MSVLGAHWRQPGRTLALTIPFALWAGMVTAQAAQLPPDQRTPAERSAHISTLGPMLDYERMLCMSGRQAAIIADAYKDSREPRPDVGELCMLLMEHSADTERDPSAVDLHPDKALLAPFRRIARNKGFRGTDEVATVIVEALARTASSTAAQTSIGPGRLPVSGGNGEPLVLVPGVAWEVGFTRTMRGAQSADRTPPTRMDRPALITEARKCFTNVQQTIGVCYDRGVEHARHHLALRGPSAAAASADGPPLKRDAKGGAQSTDAAHRRLYASDPIYRAQMDALAAEATKDRKQANDRDEKTDALLRQHGIATSVDGALEEQRRRRAGAERRGDTIEMLRLDTVINELRERQLAEARAQARKQGELKLIDSLGKDQ